MSTLTAVATEPLMTIEELREHRTGALCELRDALAEGYDVFEAAEIAAARGEHWAVVPSWGRDGWYLGAWPYWAFFVRNAAESTLHRFEVAMYVTGTLTIWAFDSQAKRIRALDRLARIFWDATHAGPAEDGPEARGPFSWERLETAGTMG